MSMPPNCLIAALASVSLSSGVVKTRLDIFDTLDGVLDRTGGGDDTRSAGQQALDRGAAKTFGAAANKPARLPANSVGFALILIP